MPGSRDSLRDRLLNLVAQLELVRDGSLRFPLVVEVRGAGGGLVRFEIQGPTDLQLDPLAGLNARERALVQATTATPVTRKRLASLAGQRLNRHFHDAVKGLVEAGVLREDHRGVWRP